MYSTFDQICTPIQSPDCYTFKPNGNQFFEKLSNNYLELLENKEDFNVIIKIGESPNDKPFQAHSAILKHRSLYFRNELKTVGKDGNNIKTINLKNISIQQFEIIIK
ncbi:hypothetical protein C2G38_2189936 [Gigaspora rosea]|uniref:BTB domain-containing protein n=1 Tax=Gigaspora rosea TaxID=44941 RepID=A0A397V501_9GLOM|nr:hypothetical protein C2G38_2189936 [Gigaspora rosea]